MNQYSRWALAAGVAKGETVALAMGNRPEYSRSGSGSRRWARIVALLGAELRGPRSPTR